MNGGELEFFAESASQCADGPYLSLEEFVTANLSSKYTTTM